MLIWASPNNPNLLKKKVVYESMVNVNFHKGSTFQYRVEKSVEEWRNENKKGNLPYQPHALLIPYWRVHTLVYEQPH